MARRTDVDYGDFESITQSEAEDSVERADRLLNQIDALRQRLGAELDGPAVAEGSRATYRPPRGRTNHVGRPCGRLRF